MATESKLVKRSSPWGAGGAAFLPGQESRWGVLLATASGNLRRVWALIGVTVLLLAASMVVQGAGFTYQGRLNDGSRPASGLYDMTFSLYGENAGGSRLRGPEPHSNVSVSNGLFAVTLDFGDKYFDGTVYWIEMAVRTNGESGFTIWREWVHHFEPAPSAFPGALCDVFDHGRRGAGGGCLEHPGRSVGGTVASSSR